MARQNLFKRTLVTCSALLPILVYAAPQANLEASRTSGPAPLAVFFDATGTTDTNSSVDTFRQLGYQFQFADPSSGTWRASGRSKNEQRGGPLAAHIFNTPGTYRVSVSATDASGAASDTSVTITVTDPNATYSGSNTVVISRNSDTSGAPAGAQLITNASSWPALQSNRRYLIKSGQDYSSFGNLNIEGLSNVQVRAFGSGERPVVRNTNIVSWPGVQMSNIVVSGLEMDTLLAQHQLDHVLVMDNRVKGSGGATDFMLATGFNRAPSDWRRPRGIFAVENYVDGNSNYGMYIGDTKNLVLMGNTIPTWGREHGIRIVSTYKSIVSHNSVEGRNTGSSKHLLKINGGGLEDWNDRNTGNPATRYVVVSDNSFGDTSSLTAQKIQTAPQNNEESEGLQDILLENNRFTGNAGPGTEVVMGGRRMTERGHSEMNAVTSRNLSRLPASWDGPYYLGDNVINPAPASSAPTPPVLQITQ